ncbi:hypothetical protein CLOSTMETH_03932 [[Clostridium] methylpentosum DSM 5476]|uniref:Uncharacterized protein n=1 Tax=[Clostridium] methylpentosum DSM 5476 TaxID=537013 RepID=C0EJ81_9FIRM|nr:hypothetical protein CLOSTMETH_03932 [[Clostridium] methylpentosum DSM 5476]
MVLIFIVQSLLFYLRRLTKSAGAVSSIAGSILNCQPKNIKWFTINFFENLLDKFMKKEDNI